jgi:zinc/manganese transport system permease protein
VQHFWDVLSLLSWPFAACISMGLLHGYAGLHVLRRGVIFVDLALAQMAALGAVVSLFFATHPGEPTHRDVPALTHVSAHSAPAPAGGELDQALQQAADESRPQPEAAEAHHAAGLLDYWPTAFALGGAVLLAFSRMRGNRVPHEAIIGVVYVVAAAVTVLLLSKSPHGHEQMEEMLTGKLLFVDRSEVLTTSALYAVLGLLHCLFFRPFLTISVAPEEAERRGMYVRLWDMLFYAMFAIMVTRSVAIAGVLVVFSFLIIPGACAAMFVEDFKRRIPIAWLIATAVSVLGMAISGLFDLPSGSTVVATFGAALVLCYLLSSAWRSLSTKRAGLETQQEGT